jgi:urease gamma subunit
MRKTAFAVMAMLLLATTALAAGITVDNQVIEFSEVSGKTVVKHNGVDKGVAKEVGNVDVIVTLPDGTRAIHDDKKFKDIFIVYRVNPTCVTYWNGRAWTQYCW